MIKDDTAIKQDESLRQDAGDKTFSAPATGGGASGDLSADFRETLRRSGLDAAAFDSAVREDSSDPKNFPTEETEKVSFDENRTARKKRRKILSGIAGWQKVAAVSIIAVVIGAQSFFQFSLIGDENLQAIDLLKDEIKVESGEETKIAEVPSIEEIPETVKVSELKKIIAANEETKAANISAEKEIATPSAGQSLKSRREKSDKPFVSSVRKKEARPSSAECLRRAEKILTGV